MNTRVISSAVLALAVGAPVLAGDVLHVDDDAAPGGDGASWETAYRFLQDALASSGGGAGTEIRIGQGTYLPDRDEANPAGSGDQVATFELVDAAHLVGGYLGLSAGKGESPDERDSEAYETILSGDLLGDDGDDFTNNEENSHHVITSLAGPGAVHLEGLIVRGGNAVTIEDEGGALLCQGVTMVTDCRFEANAAASGGAVDCSGQEFTATDSRFIANKATVRGGAIAYFGGMATLVNCEFRENLGVAGSGAVESVGTLHAVGCSFVGNAATGPSSIPGAVGGGAVLLFSGGGSFLDCRFEGNTVTHTDPDAFAVAGALCLCSAATVMNCVFLGNSAEDFGGAIQIQADDVFVRNCTIVANAADSAGAVNVVSTDLTDIANCIVVDNTSEPITPDVDVVHHSCVEGGYPGEGNIDADPLFVLTPAPGPDQVWGTDDDVGDLRLRSGSPCVDAADNTAVPEKSTTDLDGNPRFVDDPETPDTGIPDGVNSIVDMGVYELCRADTNRDGTVDVQDLVDVILAWDTDDVAADTNADGIVDVTDLIAVILNWGPCQ